MIKNNDSVLDAYRKAKKTEEQADPSEKVMAITTAGGVKLVSTGTTLSAPTG